MVRSSLNEVNLRDKLLPRKRLGSYKATLVYRGALNTRGRTSDVLLGQLQLFVRRARWNRVRRNGYAEVARDGECCTSLS